MWFKIVKWFSQKKKKKKIIKYDIEYNIDINSEIEFLLFLFSPKLRGIFWDKMRGKMSIAWKHCTPTLKQNNACRLYTQF